MAHAPTDRAGPRRIALATGMMLALSAVLVAWAAQSRGAPLLPHGICFTWFPQLLWLHVISDTLIFLAYLSIPVGLAYFVRRRTDLPFNWMFLLFGLFIVACGIGHALDVWTIWNPDYWLSGTVKALTAAVSVPTAMALVYLIPRALALPSTAQLRQANEALEREVAQRVRAETELRRVQADLEQRVLARSQELVRAQALLSTVFERAPVGLGVWDIELCYVRVNETLAGMSALPRDEQVGRPIAQVLPDIAPVVGDAMRAVLATGEPARDLEVLGTAAATGSRRCWSMSLYAVRVEGRPVMVGGIFEDITDRRQADLERSRTLADAEAQNRRKDEFLAMLAHELRNPLAPLTNALQLLSHGALAPEQRGPLVAMAGRHTRQLSRLVDDLLEVARITRGAIALRRAPAALDAVLEEAVEAVAPALQARRQQLAVDIAPGIGPVTVDAARLVQVLTNLLNNASKFTPEQGSIRIGAAERAGDIEIRVVDNGIGIAADKLPRIFDLFVQVDATFDRASGGLGIGLALVRRLVELHGGSVSAHSDGSGHGACFVVRLPAGDDSVALRPASAHDQTPALAT